MPSLDFKRLKELFIAALQGIVFVFAVMGTLALFVYGMAHFPTLAILVLGAALGIFMYGDD